MIARIAKYNGKEEEFGKHYIFDCEHERKEINFDIITAGSNYQKSKIKDQEIARNEKI